MLQESLRFTVNARVVLTMKARLLRCQSNAHRHIAPPKTWWEALPHLDCGEYAGAGVCDRVSLHLEQLDQIAQLIDRKLCGRLRMSNEARNM